MRTAFFPLASMQEIVDRQALIMAEFHTWVPETAPVYMLMQLSDKANQIREDRRKAAQEGKTYVG